MPQPQPRPIPPLFDVVATHIDTGGIKVLIADKHQARAEAFLERVLMKGPSDSIVYAVVPAGSVAAKGRFPWRAAWVVRN